MTGADLDRTGDAIRRLPFDSLFPGYRERMAKVAQFAKQPAPTIAAESWFDVRDEIMPLWRRHYLEIADKRIPLDPDWDRYDQLALAGKLHVVAVRLSGCLVGYLFAIVDTHLHYRRTLFASFDLYYVDPAHRRGWTGVRLFREAERGLRERGVKKIVGNTKLRLDVSRIFARLGFDETERIHTKYLGEK